MLVSNVLRKSNFGDIDATIIKNTNADKAFITLIFKQLSCGKKREIQVYLTFDAISAIIER